MVSGLAGSKDDQPVNQCWCCYGVGWRQLDWRRANGSMWLAAKSSEWERCKDAKIDGEKIRR